MKLKIRSKNKKDYSIKGFILSSIITIMIIMGIFGLIYLELWIESLLKVGNI